jgi:hypothetical protein
VGLTARTAACFCVFLTLETATFFDALRVGDFDTDFLFFEACFVAAFFAGLAFAGFRAGVFAALARLALGLAAALAFTARFAVFFDAARAVDLGVDRRKPFVRLLLMCVISGGC